MRIVPSRSTGSLYVSLVRANMLSRRVEHRAVNRRPVSSFAVTSHRSVSVASLVEGKTSAQIEAPSEHRSVDQRGYRPIASVAGGPHPAVHKAAVSGMAVPGDRQTYNNASQRTSYRGTPPAFPAAAELSR